MEEKSIAERKVVENYYKAKLEYEEAKENFDLMKKHAKSFFMPMFEQEELKLKTFSLNDGKVMSIRLVSPKTKVYNIDAIEKTLSEPVKEKVINKKYVISDWPKMIDTFKKAKIKASEITPYIIVEKTVNEAQLKQHIELGHISKQQQAEFVSEKEKTKYLKITHTK